MQAMKEWYASHPHLFQKRPYDRPGCDRYGNAIASDHSGERIGQGRPELQFQLEGAGWKEAGHLLATLSPCSVCLNIFGVDGREIIQQQGSGGAAEAKN
jgi:hypothetical protein